MPIYKSENKLVFFAHIPKCAGSTLENYLAKRFGKAAFLDGQYLKVANPWNNTSPQHIDAKSLSRLFPDDFFDISFAVVRHPVDRLVSAYRWQKYQYKSIADEMGFSSWLRSVAEDIQKQSSVLDNHLRYQTDLIPPKSKIFKLEDGLDKVIDFLNEKFGRPDQDIPLDNKNQLPSGETIVPCKDDILLIETLYAWDYFYLGYPRTINHIAEHCHNRTPDQITFALKLPCPTVDVQWRWGDFHLATGLANALQRHGYQTRLDAEENWDAHRQANDIDIVIRGKVPYLKRPGNPCIFWFISNPDNTNWRELVAADHVFVASQPLSKKVAKKIGAEKVTLLPQAFDTDRILEPTFNIRNKKPLFVGIAREFERPCIQYALALDLDIDLIGRLWDNKPASKYVIQQYIDNKELGNLYHQYKIVLNDHMPHMRNEGMLSNRVFDSLACASIVVSDAVTWLPDDIKPMVYIYTDMDSFKDAIAKATAEDDHMFRKRIEFAKAMRNVHSFDNRADTILRVLKLPAQSFGKSTNKPGNSAC